MSGRVKEVSNSVFARWGMNAD